MTRRYTEATLGGKIQNSANLAHQGLRREGFLQIGDALLQNSVAHDRIIGIAGHENHLRIRIRLREQCREIASAHVRHHDVRQEEMDVPSRCCQTNSRLTIRGVQHVVSISFEHSARHGPHGLDVFNDEDGLSSTEDTGRRCRYI